MISENPYQSPAPDAHVERHTVRPTKKEYALAAAAALWIGYLVVSVWLEAVWR